MAWCSTWTQPQTVHSALLSIRVGFVFAFINYYYVLNNYYYLFFRMKHIPG